MKLFKLAVLLSAFVLISTVAWAGNIPEYDAVGTDNRNFYSLFTIYYLLPTALPRNLLRKIPYIIVEENELKREEI